MSFLCDGFGEGQLCSVDAARGVRRWRWGFGTSPAATVVVVSAERQQVLLQRSTLQGGRAIAAC